VNPAILYAVGTLASWVGWVALLRAIFLGVRLVLKGPGVDPERTRRGFILAAVVAGVSLLLGNTLPMDLGRPAIGDGPHLPIVWFAMGVQSWMIVIGLFMIALRVGQGWLALTEKESLEKFKAAGAWMIFSGVFAYWQAVSGPKVEIIRGAIAFSWTSAAALLILSAGAIVAMAAAGRKAQGRGYSRAVISHIGLLVGCVIFGIPFAWMLVTSFKEDKDLTSVNGIVWVPRVSDTVPYHDPIHPQFETDYKGSTVVVQKYQDLPQGRVQVEIYQPIGIRGITFEVDPSKLKEVPKDIPVVTGTFDNKDIKGMVVEELDGGDRRVQILEPAEFKGTEYVAHGGDLKPIRHIGLNIKNYPDSLAFLPPETNSGLVYLKNTLIIVIMSVIGTLLSCSLVAYGFSRLRFPGKTQMFFILLSTMMLPGAVTLLPTFLIYRQLGWIDTLYPLWVSTFFAGAFNVFLLRQFFMTIPMELEDAAKIDGCSYLRTYWQVMIPQVKPALAAIAIWTFMGAWNNFMGPLIYINSPENMPIAYAVQLFQGQRGGEQHLMMAFATMSMMPVLLLFFFAQKYFIEGVTLSGLGGR
jgi:multiple sugar transport system permease protein